MIKNFFVIRSLVIRNFCTCTYHGQFIFRTCTWSKKVKNEIFPPASFSSTKLEQRLKNCVHLSLLAGQPTRPIVQCSLIIFTYRKTDQKVRKMTNIRIRTLLWDNQYQIRQYLKNVVAQLCIVNCLVSIKYKNPYRTFIAVPRK